MQSNASLIAKADLALTELSSGGGLLPEEKARQFWEITLDESAFLKAIKTQPVDGTSYTQPKIGLSSWTFGPQVEFQAVAETDRVKVDTGSVTLTPKPVKWATKISYEQLHQNIEKDSMLNTVMGLLGRAFSRDLAIWVLLADTATVGDTLRARALRMADGVLKRVTANLYDASGARLSKAVLDTMYRKMPQQFRVQERLEFITSTIGSMDYVSSVSNRQTAAGDAALNGISKATGGGKYGTISVNGYPSMPETLGSGDKTNVILADPKQILLGMGKSVMVESVKNPLASCWDIVGTCWIDVNIMHNAAMVKATNVLASA